MFVPFISMAIYIQFIRSVSQTLLHLVMHWKREGERIVYVAGNRHQNELKRCTTSWGQQNKKINKESTIWNRHTANNICTWHLYNLVIHIWPDIWIETTWFSFTVILAKEDESRKQRKWNIGFSVHCLANNNKHIYTGMEYWSLRSQVSCLRYNIPLWVIIIRYTVISVIWPAQRHNQP